MGDLVMSYNKYFKVTTARYANIAFNNGSQPDGRLHSMQKQQPLAALSDVKRYFVSPEESGLISMFACIFGKSVEVIFLKLDENLILTLSSICYDFIKALERLVSI